MTPMMRRSLELLRDLPESEQDSWASGIVADLVSRSSSPQKGLFSRFRRCGSLYERGILTPSEMIHGLFHEFAEAEEFWPEIIPFLWELLPIRLRGEFLEMTATVFLDDYEFQPPVTLGGSREWTDEPLRIARDRVRLWSRGFVEHAQYTVS